MGALGFVLFLSRFLKILIQEFQDGKLTGKELKTILDQLIDDDVEIDVSKLVGYIRFLLSRLEG